jgi:hypothetical protein
VPCFTLLLFELCAFIKLCCFLQLFLNGIKESAQRDVTIQIHASGKYSSIRLLAVSGY